MVLPGLRAAVWTEDADPRQAGDQAGGRESANDEEMNSEEEISATEYKVKARHKYSRVSPFGLS